LGVSHLFSLKNVYAGRRPGNAVKAQYKYSAVEQSPDFHRDRKYLFTFYTTKNLGLSTRRRQIQMYLAAAWVTCFSGGGGTPPELKCSAE
jgi:hypothetical protein